MLFSLGCRFYSFTWCIKYKMLIHRIYVCQRNNKIYLRTVHNAYNFWSSNSIASQVVIFSLPVLKGSANPTAPCSSTSLSVLKLENRFLNKFARLLYLLWDFLQTVMRGIQLTCTFTPILLFYPLTNMNCKLKSAWYKMLLVGIGLSGPIIIKLGQWASTRRDLFSEELCFYLTKLQRKTIPHSWYYTKKCFENAYGPNWRDIFIEFDNDGQPIGSGCCAQVYKAWIKKDIFPASVFSGRKEFQTSDNFLFVEVLEMLGLGYLSTFSEKRASQDELEQLMPVAVKVRHPQMERKFRQDLNILKFFANTITWLVPSVKWLSLRECVADFSQVMESQVNFCTEAENLKQFAENFKNSNTVKFPSPLSLLTRSNILVETFEEGQHIDEFLTFGVNEKIRRDLALRGVNTILKMVFEDNFIHGDLHPGNMLVQRNKNKSFWSFLPSLKITREASTLVILDCGIVATLDERGKTCLRDVFAAVARVDGERVAELFLQHSNHECSDVLRFKQEMKDIVENALSKQVTLQKVDVSVLMNSLFSTMIHHKVKVDSSFSSVILAIMVIEGLGRSLDPSLDILAKAKPFLLTSALQIEEEIVDHFSCFYN